MTISAGNVKFYKTIGWSFHDHSQMTLFQLSESKPTRQRSGCSYKSALKNLRSEGLEVSHCKRSYKKKRTPRHKSEKYEGTVFTKGPITIPEPQVETRRPVPVSPKPFLSTTLHTPATRPQASDFHGLKLADTNYVPFDTEHSRRELSTTSLERPFKPLTVGM
jgi:hypothetical protein